VNGLGTGRIPAEQFYRLDSALVGLNSTSVQNVLGVGVTLVGSTVYQFEQSALLAKTSGTTSHTFATAFGGTSTLNNISYNIVYGYDSGGSTSPAAGAAINWFASNAAQALSNPQTSAGLYVWYIMKGTVSINAGGTFIPQYQLSAAPGGAYTTAIGSYFKISPLGASGSNTSIGTWS
jgi:hypothetical protein